MLQPKFFNMKSSGGLAEWVGTKVPMVPTEKKKKTRSPKKKKAKQEFKTSNMTQVHRQKHIIVDKNEEHSHNKQRTLPFAPNHDSYGGNHPKSKAFRKAKKDITRLLKRRVREKPQSAKSNEMVNNTEDIDINVPNEDISNALDDDEEVQDRNNEEEEDEKAPELTSLQRFDERPGLDQFYLYL